MCTLLIACAWTDISCRKVKNGWLILGTLAGTAVRGADFWFSAALVLAAAFLLFRIGVLGSGDGKLMAVITGYLGLYEGLAAIGFGMVAAVLWSWRFHTHKQSIRIRFGSLAAYIRQIFLIGKTTAYYEPDAQRKEDTIPLAACLAAGTGAYLFWKRFW
ncbi:MAG: prepilin peptidase [Lachnospiraceae bacterium]